MNKNTETSINQIIKASHENKLVFFVGAGVSLNAGVPMWSSLVNQMLDDLGLTKEDEDDMLKIPQLYYNEFGREKYINKIRTVLKYNKVSYKDNKIIEGILNGIIALNPKHIITTNYDTLIEQAIYDKHLPFSTIAEDRDLAYLHNDRIIVKMHGDFEKFNMVLKEDDFLNYSANFPLIENFVKGLFSYNTIVFVGISFTDINLKYILERVHHILDEDTPSCYLIYTGKEPLKKSQADYYWKKHIKVLSFSEICESNNENNQGNKLKKILETIKRKEKEENKFEIYKIADSDTQAQKFVKTIKHIKAVYEQYDDLGCVRPEIIVNAPPFGNNFTFKHGYVNGYLPTENKTLFDLFIFIAEWVEIKDNCIIKTSPNEQIKNNPLLSTPEIAADIIINELIKNKSDLFFILKKMHQTPIHYIEYAKEIEERKRYIHIPVLNGNSDSLFTLDTEFKLDYYLKKLKSINDTWQGQSDLSMLLNIAYHNTKVSNYSIAYDIFNYVAKMAWEKEKYVLYFIACYNIHQIKRESFDEKRSVTDQAQDFKHNTEQSNEEKSNARETYDTKIREIYAEFVEKNQIESDMEKLLPVMWKNKKLLEELKYLKSEDCITIVQTQLVEDLRGIKDGYRYGRDMPEGEMTHWYHNRLYDKMYTLNFYYTYNNLCWEQNTRFISTVETVLDGFLWSYNTYSKHSKIEKLDTFIILLAIKHLSADNFYALLKFHNIKNLDIFEKATNDVIIKFYNFINSFIEEYLFGKNYEETISIKQMKEQDIFRRNIENIYYNWILLFSVTDNKYIDSAFCEKLIEFMKVAKKYNLFTEKKYIYKFLCRHIKQFHKEQIDFLFNNGYLVSNYDYNFELIQYIAKHNLYYIENKAVLEKKLGNTIIFRNFPYWTALYNIVTPKHKVWYKNKLIKIMSNNEGIGYPNLCDYNIIKYNDYPALYENYLDNMQSYFVLETDSEQARARRNYMISIYKWNVDRTNPILQEISKRSNEFNWLINPEKFDYTNFNTDWIIKYKSVAFIKALSKIQLLKDTLLQAIKVETSMPKKHILEQILIELMLL